MIIKVNEDSYFYDSLSGKRLDKYDPTNKDLAFVAALKNITLHVSGSIIQVNPKYGIYFKYDNKTYYIDDNYQQELVSAGYIVFDDYDTKRMNNSVEGSSRKDKIFKAALEILNDVETCSSCKISNIADTSSNIIVDYYYNEIYNGSMEFRTISNTVNLNKARKDNNVAMYPFIKNMDKYNTVYVAIFQNRLGKEEVIQNNMIFNLPLAELATAIWKSLVDNGENFETVKYVPAKVSDKIIKCNVK